MKVVRFVGAGLPLSLETAPEPSPGAGEVVIRVGRCGICGTDVHLTSGSVLDYPKGTLLGHEYAGEVVALGSSVTRLRIGDSIAAMPLTGCGVCNTCQEGMPHHCLEVGPMCGGFAEYAKVDERYAFLLPASLSFVDGALVEPVASALRGVRAANLTETSTVLVIGAGSIGISAVFWARRFGAKKIVVTARTSAKAELALKLGADALIATPDEGMRGAVIEELGGPADMVIECAGVPGGIAQAIDYVKRMGTVVGLGGCAARDTFYPVIAMQKETRLLFSASYNVREFAYTIETMAKGFPELRAMVSKVISTDQVPETIESMRLKSHHCKVHVDPRQPARA
jgi:(R,R)-butanediol dehydrogenase/meso-butanediol dehydrogenase/diacetyl reductase